jgi:hypothetical protein
MSSLLFFQQSIRSVLHPQEGLMLAGTDLLIAAGYSKGVAPSIMQCRRKVNLIEPMFFTRTQLIGAHHTKFCHLSFWTLPSAIRAMAVGFFDYREPKAQAHAVLLWLHGLDDAA